MASYSVRGNINDYSIKPKSLTQYTQFRGVTDFTQIGQFDQFETGYSFLSVISMPKFVEVAAGKDTEIKKMVESFKHMLEFEFRGLEGLPDINGETYSITDGINEQKMINKVTMDTSVTLSSNYFERKGGLITKFSEYYLTGIKDKMTQAKTYHGLIEHGDLNPGLENEVFTMLYYVTDNTMLRIERAFLLCNCQLTKAENSMYNSTRGEINNKEMTIEWNCFPITGNMVDHAAQTLLQDITGVKYDVESNKFSTTRVDGDGHAVLESANHKYAIMNSASPDKDEILVDAVKGKINDKFEYSYNTGYNG